MPIEGDQSAPQPVLSHKIRVAGLDDAIDGRITFAEIGYSRIAAFLGAQSLDELSISYRFVPIANGRLALTGHVEARLTQLCVVTREPVAERIDELLDLECWPDDQIGELPDEAEGEGLQALPQDPPVPIVQGQVDLGALAVEIVASAMNPYPRKQDAAFDWHDPKSEGSPGGPFAGLAKLKPKG